MNLQLPVVCCAMLAVLGSAVGCDSKDGRSSADAEREATADGPAEPTRGGVLDVTAQDFAFDAPGEIPSGWTTVRMRNAGQQEHFLYLYRLPDHVTYQTFQEEFNPAFGSIWEAYASGTIDRAAAEARFGEELPEWFLADIVPAGGPAITEPGETAETIVRLEPGTYVMECYVKTPEGTWHTELGMQRRLVVTDASNDASPPSADTELVITNYAITGPAELPAGKHTIAVRIEEDPEGFMLHDVNLFRLDDDTKVNEIVRWMDWMDLEAGFRAPAPGYSLGGVEHMTAGRTGYATVELTPGDYAWVSEGYAARGAVLEFVVR
ncbi:hypothetical protein BH24PSE2_BH24PSE2_19430 [soil metagenome]